MSVGFAVGNLYWEAGAADFLNAFFSTVSYRLESEGEGTRFPALWKLYETGHLSSAEAGTAFEESEDASRGLKRFSPAEVIWDRKNLDARPPWGSNISPEITDLSNYFVTSDGRDLFGVLLEALKESKDSGYPFRIE